MTEDEYLEGTAIKYSHIKKIKDIADKFNIPIYIFGSRAKGDIKKDPSLAKKDLDLGLVMDKPEDEEIIISKYEEISKEVRSIEDVEHNPLPIYLRKITKIFDKPEEVQDKAGYLISQKSDKLEPYFFDHKNKRKKPKKDDV